MENRLDSKLFERVKVASKRLTGKTYGLARVIGVNELTFKGYCSESREGNLWPLLPAILAAFPEISREWLYFNEGEMLQSDEEASPSATPTEMRGKMRMYPGYHCDPPGMQLYERLLQLVSAISGNSQTKFAKSLGMAQTTFLGYLSETGQSKIRVSFLDQILNTYPQIRREWLYFGEGEMLQSDKEVSSSATPPEIRGKLRLHPGYHYDPLGRIEMLTNVRGSIAAELQAVFGVDLKELKPFVARYNNARQAWDAWRAAGSREEDVPDVELPQIPEDWLDYFWRHYGPSPQWVLYGGGDHGWSALVRPHPGMAETERLRGELSAIKEEAQRLRDEAVRLRQALADAREKNARLEATLEEPTAPDKEK